MGLVKETPSTAEGMAGSAGRPYWRHTAPVLTLRPGTIRSATPQLLAPLFWAASSPMCYKLLEWSPATCNAAALIPESSVMLQPADGPCSDRKYCRSVRSGCLMALVDACAPPPMFQPQA